MIIGCPKEIKDHEFRVGLTPSNVHTFSEAGCKVYIEKGAGEAINFYDEDYKNAGAIIADKEELFEKSEMIIKVKEPVKEEYDLFKEKQVLYTYLHLANDKELTEMLLKKKIFSIAYETIRKGKLLPCLAPMSSIAGRLSIIEGAKYLEKTYGGNGTFIGGAPGTRKGKVLILGGGNVGFNAAQMALGLGAEVIIADIDLARLEYIDQVFHSKITTLYSDSGNIKEWIRDCDILIGSVLIPGSKAPKLIRKEHLKLMKKGAVIVDVAIDQGGCIETSHPTTHTDPIYIIDGIVHYSVANMPGAVAKTSTIALTNTTVPYGLKIATLGAKEACLQIPELTEGLNTIDGKITYKGIAQAFGADYFDPIATLQAYQ
ncbi:alanine dehydrogenase [Helicobacter sp. 12S02232-10]|uniref:alanine dehydrogenase n=1 Tax=Helicobacter sp. 12S02232-10 TaxID=1476197 RepID=UPI000BA7711D|nr:alanine dehydrogenase [Helicobacter sp. 12S02232-10]PAF49409.1 alanine dehydrogenase [Helicobacter sp. 12S02232-10]